MKVVSIGNFDHPHCTEVHTARALRENGADVLEHGQVQAHHLGPSAFGDLLLTGALSSPRPDLVLYTRTHNQTALGASWTDCWRRLGRAGIKTASFHLDRFWDLEREHLIHDADPLFTVDYCCTADGGNDDRFKAAGVNHHWLPPGVDRIEALVEGRQLRDVPDIVFVGSDYSQTSHGPYYPQRGELLRHLRATYGRRFVQYGYGGERGNVRQQDLNDVYCSAKIVVGDSCFANSPDRALPVNYWSDRIPETVGRGGFLIHPYVPGIRGQYSGSELACYNPGDWDDLDAQIGAFLANPGEREGYVERGRARVLRDHTYSARMAELLRVCGLESRDPEPVIG